MGAAFCCMVARRVRSRWVRAVLCVALVVPLVVMVPAAAQTPGRGGRPIDPADVPDLRSQRPDPDEPAQVADGEGYTVQTPEPPGAVELPEPVVERPERRDGFTRVFENEDGSLTVDSYASPINYPTPDGWEPIDNSLAPDRDRPGWVATDGNTWKVAFGPADEGLVLESAGASLSLTPVLDEVTDEPPAVVAPESPTDEEVGSGPVDDVRADDATAEPGVVHYDDAAPGVDLEYEVSANGVKEAIVVADRDAGHRFPFELGGASATLRADGGIDLGGPVGAEFDIPAPTVRGADGSDLTADAGARYELRPPATDDGPTTIVVVLDETWLTEVPDDVFPLRIDPSFTLVAATAAVTYTDAGGTHTNIPIHVGRFAPFNWVYRAAVRFNQYESFFTGNWRVYHAEISFGGQLGSMTALTVYDQGSRPSSFAAIGTDRPVVDGPYNVGFVDVSDEVDRWVTQDRPGQWFGVRTTETGDTFRELTPRLIMNVYEPPQASLVTNIADQQVLATTTPILQSQPVPFAPDDPPVAPRHEFQITTSPAPGTGLVLSSGMLPQPSPSQGAAWAVPPGSLVEGLTYWAWVLTDFPQFGGPPAPTVPPSGNGRRFTVDLGLGDGGVSPTDQLVAPPSAPASPAEAAPSPGLAPTPVTVNLVDGNLSVRAGTTSLATLGGPLAVELTYNSLAPGNRGLRGEFFNDTNGSGAIDTGDTPVGQRIDPTVSFDFGYGPLAKPVAASDPTRALARWTGLLRVPQDGRTWQLGAISSDGLRASVDGQPRLDRWATHEPESTPAWGDSFTASTTTPLPLQVEWRNSSDRGVARMYLRDVTTPSSPVVYHLSPEWLRQNTANLPPGWTMNAAPGVGRWVGLADRGSSVSVFSSDGSAREFVAVGDGSYRPPIDAPNDLLTLSEDGRFVLRDGGGTTYSFRADGTLDAIDSAVDDRAPAALRYGYSGNPVRLRTITDPVSERSVTLNYVGDSECPTPAAASGFLCRMAFWDGSSTTLDYNAAGQLTAVTNPGGMKHGFAYDSAGRLWRVRDPLATDAIAAGIRADDATAVTEITYDAAGRAYVILMPAPTVGAERPGRLYTYDPANRTGTVSIAGFTPTVGFAERVRYDSRNRLIERTGSDGGTSTFAWDGLDRVVATTDTAGTRTTTSYDHASRPVVRYGPAPATSFNANGLPNTAGVPATTTVYDGGINALAAEYWTNPFHAGGPSLHDTGLGNGGTLDRDWGTDLPVDPGASGWSARWSGFVNAPTSGGYTVTASTRGRMVRIWIDDVPVVTVDQPESATGWQSATSAAFGLTAGHHRIRIDMVDEAGPAGLRVLWDPPGTTPQSAIDGAFLTPNYGLVTQVTDPDGKASATEYSDPGRGIGPHHRLATATIADPLGVALRTSYTYEAAGPDSLLRRVARTLPAGNAWVTTHYDGTEGPVDAVCGVAAGTPQAGLAKRVTGPDPDGTGPATSRVEEYVYDAIGRQVGRREGTAATVATAGWQCAAHDARGRITAQTWPSHNGMPARTVNHAYAVGGNPLVNRVVDAATGSIVAATVDLLGRPTSYTDAWGNTTTMTYDRPGRQVQSSGPLGILAQNFETATGRVDTVVANGVTLADPSYDGAGRLSAVAFGNGTASTFSYDAAGRPNAIGIFDATGTNGEILTRSSAGRVVEQQIAVGNNFVDANSAGSNYLYDGAGRLTTAYVPGTNFTYGFGSSPGCTAPAAGANTNRTTAVVNGIGSGTTSSCYDHADQLLSTTSIPAGQIVYDDHGNNVRIGSEYLTFDASDRHVTTESATNHTTYRRDAVDRIIERLDATRITHVNTATATTATSSASGGRPSGTQAGDLVLAAVVGTGPSAPTALTQAGWTIVGDRTSGNVRTWVLRRYATASDPASWSFTAAGSTATTVSLTAYRNAAAVGVVSASATGAESQATSHPYPTVTTPSSANHLVHVTGLGGAATPTFPPSVSTRANVSAGASLLVADRYQREVGSSSAAAVTTTGALTSASVTVALAPATTTTRYGYGGHDDASMFTTSTTGALTGFTIPLPGNAAYVHAPSLTGYSHSNLHGDTISVTDLSGARVWQGHFGPYGERAFTAPPLNATGVGTSLAWHGQQLRLTDRSIVHLGARPYAPIHGRFLAVDPLEGGCANDYVYGFGDPTNLADLSGRGIGDWLGERWDEFTGALDWAWDNTFGKVLTCSDNSITGLIDAFGLVPTIEGGDADRDNGTRYHAVALAGSVAAMLHQLVDSGRLEIDDALARRLLATSADDIAKWIGRFSTGMTYATIAATAYQFGRWLLC